MVRIFSFLGTFILVGLIATSSHAAKNNFSKHAVTQRNLQSQFDVWVEELRLEAKQKGISDRILNEALADIKVNEKVVKLDKKQPYKTKTFADYKKSVLPKSRIKKAQKLAAKHADLLKEVSAKYGVQPRFIVALWGIESNFGGYMGNFSIIEALANLAFEGRRAAFFRKELLTALRILEDGHIKVKDMKGSWAGAMGQSQFMPSSFMAFAVDYDGDGKKDIWGNKADVFASIANYLSKSGWNDDLTWGRKVDVPGNFNKRLSKRKEEKLIAEWNSLGVRSADGSKLPSRNIKGYIALPGEKRENAYLVYDNYKVLLKWNRSLYFATVVGLLSDAIKINNG